ncbi:MAG: hypothetical protein WBM32_17930, partial [Crocosphaera sp.]
IWSLLNIIALLGATGSFLFLGQKINQIIAKNKDEESYLIKLDTQNNQPQQQEKDDFANKLQTIQLSLMEIKDSFVDSTNLPENNNSNQGIFSIIFGALKPQNTYISLEKQKYRQIIDSLNTLGQILDDTYLATLTLNKDSSFYKNIDKTIEQIKQKIETYIKTKENSNQQNQTINEQQIIAQINKLQTLQQTLQQEIRGKFPEILSKIDSINVTLSRSSATENDIQNYNNRIQELTQERNKLLQEVQKKNSQMTQINTGETEEIRQQYEQLINENNQLKKDYKNIYAHYEYYRTFEPENSQLQIEKENLNSQLTQVKSQLEVPNNNITELQKDNERLRKRITNEAPEVSDTPPQWQNLISAYLNNPEDIRSYVQGEVTEDENKYMERRNNSSKPVILTSNQSADGYYIVTSGSDYLLFPKQPAIPISQKNTASALFDGYKAGNTRKFISILPAQVTSLGSGMWKLKHKGKLEYS